MVELIETSYSCFCYAVFLFMNFYIKTGQKGKYGTNIVYVLTTLVYFKYGKFSFMKIMLLLEVENKNMQWNNIFHNINVAALYFMAVLYQDVRRR